jgi:hypothetical protein
MTLVGSGEKKAQRVRETAKTDWDEEGEVGRRVTPLGASWRWSGGVER